MASESTKQTETTVLGKAYVINLDTRPQRWREITSRHAQFCELMSLANPQLGLVDTQLTRLSATAMPQQPSVGCALSHKRAIEAAAARGQPHVLVLEDDANWSPAVMATPETLQDVVRAATVFIETARQYADNKSCVIFLGAGTVSQQGSGIKWIKKSGQHYLGVVAAHNTVVTATHGMLYVCGADKTQDATDYTDIIKCLQQTADPDSWCTHIDLALSNTFAGLNRLFVVAPFIVHFVDQDVPSDVRVGKTTGQDYATMRDTETKLSLRAYQSGI